MATPLSAVLAIAVAGLPEHRTSTGDQLRLQKLLILMHADRSMAPQINADEPQMSSVSDGAIDWAAVIDRLRDLNWSPLISDV